MGQLVDVGGPVLDLPDEWSVVDPPDGVALVALGPQLPAGFGDFRANLVATRGATAPVPDWFAITLDGLRADLIDFQLVQAMDVRIADHAGFRILSTHLAPTGQAVVLDQFVVAPEAGQGLTVSSSWPALAYDTARAQECERLMAGLRWDDAA